MQKISKKQKLIGIISIALITIILAILITKNIITNNNQVANEKYLATTANAGSNLISSYIQKGVTIGGVTGTLESLDVSDATAIEQDVLEGQTFYAGNNEKKTGQMQNNNNWSVTVGAGQSVTVPEGYHDGTGIITGGMTGKFLASYVAWTNGSSWIQVTDSSYISSSMVFQKEANVRIYAYASASNDNQPAIVYFSGTPIVTAVTNGQLTQKTVVEKKVTAGNNITFKLGGYSGCNMVVVELLD